MIKIMSASRFFLFSKVILILVIFISLQRCSSEDNTVNQSTTGEVLLAEVSGDSISAVNGTSTRAISITGSSLNFTDRDSARFTFFYSGENSSAGNPILISYINSENTEVDIYSSQSLIIQPTEQFADVTLASPKINDFFRYRITAISSGFSYFKFRDLKIYKK